MVALSLPSRGLTGVLSPAIGNLSFLRTLDLSSNGLSGGIPASIGNLRRLQTLNLSDNALSGELPANLSSCTGLTVMAIRLNRLQGRVPSELGDKLASLRVLDLRNNNLTGTIPVSIANLSSLSYLSLAFNQIQGNIPDLDGILGLKGLDLAYNSLSGALPSSIYNLSSLQMFQIQGNMFHGGIPADFGSRFPGMRILDFSRNQFTGPIPASFSNLTNLQFILLSSNRLTGYVPPTLGRLQALQGLYLYNNRLQADDEAGWEFIASLSNCSQLQQLTLDSNAGLTGQVPSEIGNLPTTLQVLLLDDTGISGRIPSSIGNLAGLQVLNLDNTSITGVIPESIGKLGNLGVLHLYNTGLSGCIPSSIGNLSNLFQLSAYNTSLEGAIPASLGKLTDLQSLDLSMNRLNGSIPIEIFRLSIISMYLNLSHNLLSGFLPAEVGKLSNLNILDLSGNKLSGGIPDNIGECIVLQGLWLDNNSFEGSIPQSLNNIKGLTTLNLSMNKLSGKIPDTIGSIRNLQQLYLAHNNLSGLIPAVLQNLTSLSELDLSFNNLQGEVPKEGIFRNLSTLSITGNNGLCGGIPQLNLDPCHTSSIKKNTKGWLKSLTIALATISAFLFLAFMIALIRLKGNKLRRRKKSPFLPPITDEQYERVSYHALANGTNGFDEVNLLGKGSFGAVYKCTFQDEGTIVAVKVFNLEQVGSTRSFVAECEALRRVRHRCLMKIITCCSSINHQGQEFKALVFEYMPNGSLDGWLHPKSETPTQTNTLSLEQRLHIAVDIMDAMDYLHNHCNPPVLHCDLKPSNILLAEDMSARIGDFGISKILPECASKTLQNSNSTIGIRGSIGYVAPEYGEGSSVSTLGDVYSLGILLLEMFTGRSPTDDIFRGSLDLHKFSEDALPERILKIADTTMWLHTDAYEALQEVNTTRSRIENCLVSIIALGISCSKKQPRERTPIKDAVTKMHAIRYSYKKLLNSNMEQQ
uniref:Receptor kinase-like protein Xa21 n=1 Tax=Setaria italica TaxID=4555 RepID=K3XPS3_SETIT